MTSAQICQVLRHSWMYCASVSPRTKLPEASKLGRPHGYQVACISHQGRKRIGRLCVLRLVKKRRISVIVVADGGPCPVGWPVVAVPVVPATRFVPTWVEPKPK